MYLQILLLLYIMMFLRYLCLIHDIFLYKGGQIIDKKSGTKMNNDKNNIKAVMKLNSI